MPSHQPLNPQMTPSTDAAPPRQSAAPPTTLAGAEGADAGVDELTLASAGDGEATVTGSARRSVRSSVLTYAMTVFILISLNFFLPRTLPGDPVDSLIGSGGAELRLEPRDPR